MLHRKHRPRRARFRTAISINMQREDRPIGAPEMKKGAHAALTRQSLAGAVQEKPHSVGIAALRLQRRLKTSESEPRRGMNPAPARPMSPFMSDFKAQMKKKKGWVITIRLSSA